MEALLLAGNETVGRWFTPVVWTGYLLFVDALVYRVEGRSLLGSRPHVSGEEGEGVWVRSVSLRPQQPGG